jgi:hypothetical protein
MIKERTGFVSDIALINFIIVVCNGDFDVIKSIQSKLTWYEEWFFYFEAIWGRSHTRWDGQLAERFGVVKKETLYKIFDAKACLVLRCRSSWPTYATHEEDKYLRKEKWNAKYENKRIVMWDDTNIPFTYKPSSALNQRITYSPYYGMNCAKGGVFIQLCGWLGVEEFMGWASQRFTLYGKYKYIKTSRCICKGRQNIWETLTFYDYS